METPRGGSSQRRQALYDSHVPTSLLEKALLAGRAAFGALRDPARADLVADLGDATGAPALEWMRRRMRESETGRLVLAERPRVAALAELDRMEVSPPRPTFVSHNYNPTSSLASPTIMMLGHAARNVEDGGRLGWRILQETIFLELMRSESITGFD
jgi:hypothetical protein